MLLRDQFENEASGFLANLTAPLVDAGERDPHITVVMKIAAADDGNVFRNTDAGF